MTSIEISKIRTDGGTQPRARIDDQIVSDYANAMKDGDQFPPVEVFFDGSNYWLADGFHRLAAARWIKAEIAITIHQGSLEDAILYSAGANATHGLRRSNEDKRRSVMRLLSHTEWQSWSDREIARRCRVSKTFVNNLRKKITGNVASDTSVLYKDRWGNVSEMDVSEIGSRLSPRDEQIKLRWGCRACDHKQEEKNSSRTFYCIALSRSFDYDADDKHHNLSKDCKGWKFNKSAFIVRRLHEELDAEKREKQREAAEAEMKKTLIEQTNDLLFGAQPAKVDNPHSGPVHLRPHVVNQAPVPEPGSSSDTEYEEPKRIQQLKLELFEAEKQLSYWTQQVQTIREKINDERQ